MNEPKPLASLSGLLLARKGAARPAMRPQMPPLNRPGGQTANQNLEDLGWNDLGEPDDQRYPADILPLTPAPKTPEAQAEIAAEDKAAAAQLAEHARQMASGNPFDAPEKPKIVRQQEEIASRLEIRDDAEVETEAEPATPTATPAPAPTATEQPLPTAKAETSPVVRIEPELSAGLPPAKPTASFEAAPAALVPAIKAPTAEAPAVKAPAIKAPVAKVPVVKAPAIKTKAEPRAKAPAKAKAPKRARRSALAEGRRAAFTLRLDTDRHLKLRLACTIRNRSAQQIVTEALDDFLGSFPELETLAAQVKRQ